MTFKGYQKETAKLNIHDPEHNLMLCGLGLGGECGELIEHIKKYFRDGKEIDRKEFAKEAGDVLWYLSEACRAVDIDFEDVPEMNIQKLWDRRKERGR